VIFLLDTNAFSDLMRENPKIDDHLAGISPMDRVVICTVVRGEILYGIKRLSNSKRQQDLEDKAIQLFSVIPCEPILESAGDYYAMIKITQQRKGLALDENDLWIAATALALGAVLISRDSDFYQVDTLVVNNWSD
jgi:tRNA(fMet)-specific endonuclease VapC